MMQRDSAWHDRMYNNRALVPDFADHFARWQQDSARARADMRCVLVCRVRALTCRILPCRWLGHWPGLAATLACTVAMLRVCG